MLQYPGYDETTLVENAVAGDANAFGELYQIYLTPIYRYIYLRVGNVHDAEDIAEQVFLRAWEALPTYQQRGHRFSSWLYRIAHNAIVDHQRRRRYTLPLSRVNGEHWQSRQRSLPEQVIAAEEEAELSQALDQLPEEQQQVIHLRFREGLDHAEIARTINKSAGASRMIQHRALTTLGSLLQGKPSRAIGVTLTALFCLLFVRQLVVWWQQALPGDLFYAAQRNIETVQITASSRDERAWLHLRFADRRMNEVQRLLAAERLGGLSVVLTAYQTEINAVQSFLDSQSTLTNAEQKTLATALLQAETAHKAQLMEVLSGAPTALRPQINAALNTAQQARARAEQVIRGEGEEKPAEKGDGLLPTATHQPTIPPVTPASSARPTWHLVPTSTRAATSLPALPTATAVIPTAVIPAVIVTPGSPQAPAPTPEAPLPLPTATSAPPTATPAPTDAPPTETPTPEPLPTATPAPTDAPPPTPTPEPPATAIPNNVIPTVVVPTVVVPTVVVPTIEIPTVEIPTIEVPTVVLPDLGLPDNDESGD